MNFTCKQVGSALIATGLATVAVFAGINDDFHSFASLTVITGLLLTFYSGVRRLIASVCRPTQDAYSEGYESGYDKGWREGRQATHLRVVGIRQE